MSVVGYNIRCTKLRCTKVFYLTFYPLERKSSLKKRSTGEVAGQHEGEVQGNSWGGGFKLVEGSTDCYFESKS